MSLSNIIYLSEAGLLLITWIIGVILLKIKNKKGYLKLFGISSLVYIVIFGITFIVERPEMKVPEISDIEVGNQTEIEKPKVIYHFLDMTDKVRIVGDIDYNKLGEYNVSFEIDTLIGKYSKAEKVRVIDKKLPEILLEGEEEYNLSYKKEYEESGYKAVDNYDGDLTEKVLVEKEEIDETKFNIKYTVIDSSGNKAEKVRKVTIVDDIAPSITLNGSSNMNLTLNEKYIEKGAKAKDEKDGDLTSEIEITGKVDTSKAGTYVITYKVKDRSGNEAKKTRKVIVAAKNIKTDVTSQNGSTGKKGVIYLTFDDGPSMDITPKILDVLKEKNVKATFFILNYDTAKEKLVKREVAEGHSIAIHGYSHNYYEIYKSVDTYMENITKLQNKIKESIGVNTIITRFPGGSSNRVSKYNPGIMTKLCKEVVQKGYKYYDWNVSSGDAGGAKTKEQVYNNVIRGLSKSKQNIVLMHDYSGNTKTLNALSDIIDYGLANGYTFEKITKDTPMVTHTPNN